MYISAHAQVNQPTRVGKYQIRSRFSDSFKFSATPPRSTPKKRNVRLMCGKTTRGGHTTKDMRSARNATGQRLREANKKKCKVTCMQAREGGGEGGREGGREQQTRETRRTCVTLPGLEVESWVFIVWMESTMTSAGWGWMASI